MNETHQTRPSADDERERFDTNELLCITWPDSGRGPLLDVYFQFCNDAGVSIGAQIIIASLFEAAGVDIAAEITEQGFIDAMERMRERARGALHFTTYEGHQA